MNIEESMTPEQLRKSLRRAWEGQFAFAHALQHLPEIPTVEALRFIVDLPSVGTFPDDWNKGKELQRTHGYGVVPTKTEYEIAAGFWFRLRKGLLGE